MWRYQKYGKGPPLIWTKSKRTAVFSGPLPYDYLWSEAHFYFSIKLKNTGSPSATRIARWEQTTSIYRKNAKLIWNYVSLRLFLCDWTWTKSNLQKTQIWKLHLRNVVEADRGCYMCQVQEPFDNKKLKKKLQRGMGLRCCISLSDICLRSTRSRWNSSLVASTWTFLLTSTTCRCCWWRCWRWQWWRWWCWRWWRCR